MKHLLLILLALQIICTSAYSQDQIINTIVGNGMAGYNGDNIPSSSAELNGAYHLRKDSAGNIYIGDYGNHRVRKIDKNGIITTIAGNGTGGYGGDNGLAVNAFLYYPEGIAFDKQGNIYIGDDGNQVVRKIDKNGIIITFVGNHTGGYAGDGGQATDAELFNPSDLCFDEAGNLYIADTYNSAIRKVDKNGIITTFAGTGVAGFSGDNGQASQAQINFPYSMLFDRAGNLFFGDYANNRIRKISAKGIITTIAGNGTQGYSGDGGQALSAELYYPSDMIFDRDSNLIFTDQFNNVIRKIDRNGIITTIAGTGVEGFSGDNGPALQAALDHPMGIILDSLGNIIVSDRENNRIRKITPGSMPLTLLNFNSTLNKNQVICEWQTLNEINTSYFEIQRSSDGINFTSIGKVAASNFTAQIKNYSFVDQNPYSLNNSKIYYRLICADENNAMTISKISVINLNKPNAALSIWPNPVKDNLNVRVNNYEGKIAIKLSDIYGNILYESAENYNSNANINIFTGNLKSGVYFVSVNMNDIILTKGFIK